MRILFQLTVYFWNRLKSRFEPPEGAKDILVGACLVGAVFWFGKGWLRTGLPPGDFAGTVLSLESLMKADGLGSWSGAWFCGGPTAALFSNLLSFASYAPFALQFDTISAVKFGGLFYLAAGALGAYVFLRLLVGRRLPSAIGALVFALHPIGISMTASTGHANFPPLFAAMPPVFIGALLMARRPRLARIVLFALAAGLMLWVDNERGGIALLFAFAMYLALACHDLVRQRALYSKAAFKRLMLVPAFSVLLIVWAIAGFALPLFLESRHLALFSEAERESSVNFFSLNNPLFLFDRAGALLRNLTPVLPDHLTYNSGHLYLGLAPLSLLALGVFIPARREKRIMMVFSAAALLAVVWLSMGSVTLYESLRQTLGTILKYDSRALLKNPLFLVVIAFAGAIPLTLGLVARKRKARAPRRFPKLAMLYLIPILACTLLFLRPFLIFRKAVFVLAHMRSPTWFMSCVPAFAIGCGAALGADRLLRLPRRKSVRFLLAVGVLGALGLDFWPYRKEFSYYYRPAVVSAATEITGYLRNEAKQGRVLAASSYSPFLDLTIRRSERLNAWGWLNWTALSHSKEYVMGGIYRQLGSDQSRAAGLAGVASVRYILSYLPEDGLEAASPHLRKVAAIDKYVIYENLLWRPFAQVYPPDAEDWKPGETEPPAMLEGVRTAVKQRSAERFSVEVAAAREPALLALSESFHPGWRCRVDGKQARLSRFGGMFLAAEVPRGDHTVQFEYKKPPVYAAAYFISASFVVLSSFFLCAAKVRTWYSRSLEETAPFREVTA